MERFGQQDETDEADQKPATSSYNPFSNEYVGSYDILAPERRFGRSVIEVVAESDNPEKAPRIERQVAEVCEILSHVMTGDENPPEMPQCDSLEVIQMTLDHLEKSPLCLGWGDLPEKVQSQWQLFFTKTIEAYRSKTGLMDHELIPLTLTLPDWMRDQTKFDVLTSARLLDVTIASDIEGTLASEVSYCRVTVTGSVKDKARIGATSSRSSFIFENNFFASKSFTNASNVNILIKGNQKGSIGSLSSSKVKCEGSATGKVSLAYQDSGSELDGIQVDNGRY